MRAHTILHKVMISTVPHSSAIRHTIISHGGATQKRVLAASSIANPTRTTSLELIAASPLATQLLAHYFASSLQFGDAYLLFGEVGAGKSYFSRAFIRAALRDEHAPVPSPTFLLQNIYPTPPPSPPVHHFDLYRLSQPQDLSRLDLETSLPASVSLIEWAERLDTSGTAPLQHLSLRISIVSKEDTTALTEAGIVARSSGSSFPNSGDVEDSSDDDDDDDGDVRWRRVVLQSHGERWFERVEMLRQHVIARGKELGLYLLP